MKLMLEIPDDLNDELKGKFANVGQAALEALAAEAYENGILSCDQVRRLLGLASRWDAQSVLSRHGVWPGATIEDARSDMAALKKFLAAG